LALEVRTRRLVQLGFHPAMVVMPPVIHETKQRGDPANPSLYNHKPQFGITLGNRTPDQISHSSHGLKHFVISNPHTHSDALDLGENTLLGASTGVSGNDQAKILERRPETVVVLVSIRPLHLRRNND